MIYFQFTPWVALVLGLLIGWVGEWLLELFVFRRSRTACQRKREELKAELKARDAEIQDMRAHAASLQADLARLRLGEKR